MIGEALGRLTVSALGVAILIVISASLLKKTKKPLPAKK
jgi:hypothetical protein